MRLGILHTHQLYSSTFKTSSELCCYRLYFGVFHWIIFDLCMCSYYNPENEYHEILTIFMAVRGHKTGENCDL